MHTMRYSLGHGLLCVVHLYELHLKKVVVLLLHHSCVLWVSHERKEYSMSTAMAAVSARRE